MVSAHLRSWARGATLARLAVLVYAAIFGTVFAVTIPPFEAPDEPAHLAYIDFVAARAELPNQYGPQALHTGHGISPTEGHQPPFYYATAALLLRLTSQVPCMAAPPLPNPLHAWNGQGGTRTDVPMFQVANGGIGGTLDYPCLLLLRGFAVLLSVLHVAAVLALSGHFFAGPWQLVPAILVATLPQFLFMSAVVSNDGLANLLVTLCLLCALKLLDRTERSVLYLLLGLLLGLALLTKKTSLFLLPGLVILPGIIAYRHRVQLSRIALTSVAALGVTVLACGWWFGRNNALYGDPLGSEMERFTLAALVDKKSLRSPYFTGQFPRELSQSLIGMFGWMQVQLPEGVYGAYAVLASLAASGLPLWVRSVQLPAIKVAWAALFVLSCFAGIVAFNLTYSQPQGRYLFPVLGLIAVFLTAGLRALLMSVSQRRLARVAIAGLVAGLVLIDGLSLLALVQFYGRPS